MDMKELNYGIIFLTLFHLHFPATDFVKYQKVSTDEKENGQEIVKHAILTNDNKGSLGNSFMIYTNIFLDMTM